MAKNLLIVAAGDESLHKMWGFGNYDLFIVYYGNKDLYKTAGKYYHQAKGSKFCLMHQLMENHKDIILSYDAIFIPDDDLYMTSSLINKFFALFHKYNLQLAQPSIMGWGSIPVTLHQPNTLLRFTNWVEIMCPCFSKDAFMTCCQTFNENKSNWGLEKLWNKLLGDPIDKIAVIDSCIAVHTRPCFFGDTYWLNGNTYASAMQDQDNINKKYNIHSEITEYSRISTSDQDFYSRPSEDRLYPNIEGFDEFCKSLRHVKWVI